MSDDAIKVKSNLPDFKRQLDAFKLDIQKNIVRNATRAAAKVFQRAVIAAAPVLRKARKGRVAGALRNSIYVKEDRRSKAGTLHFIVSFKKSKGSDPFYGRFLEGGWLPRGPGKKLRGGTRFREVQRLRNEARGARRVRYQFIEPAAKQGAGAALQAFSEKMTEGLAKAEKAK